MTVAASVVALGELTPKVYSELRRIAAHYMRREQLDHTLQPTALVHEAYLRRERHEDLEEMTPHYRSAHGRGVFSRSRGERGVLADDVGTGTAETRLTCPTRVAPR